MTFGSLAPSGPPKFHNILYAFLWLVAALTAARRVREQIGIFTSRNRLYPATSHPVYTRSLRFRGFEPGRAFIPISFYYRLRIALCIARRGALAKRTATVEFSGIRTERATAREGLSV